MGILDRFTNWLEAENEKNEQKIKAKMKEIFEVHHFGKELKSEEDAQAQEDILLTDPHNVLARSLLFSYYKKLLFARGPDKDRARRAYLGHILWLISNEPASKLLGHHDFAHHLLTKSEFQECVELWEKQVAQNPKNTAIMENFADNIWLTNKPRAMELYRECHRLEPKEPEWCYNISRMSEGKQAIYWAEKWLHRCKRGHKGSALEALAYLHLKEENFSKSSGYAFRLKFSKDADDIHHAHTVLGMVAMHEKRIGRAKRHLMKSAAVPTSPVLGSFGPEMMLAHALLKAGEKQAVIDYLQACYHFDVNIQSKMQMLEDELFLGKIPKDWLWRYEGVQPCGENCEHTEEAH